MRLISIVVSSLFLFAGCDQLSATMQGVSILTQTPNLANSQGLDGALVSVLPLGDVGMPEATLIGVGLAQKESATSTVAPTAVSGAVVTLAWDALEAKVCEKNDTAGAYAATSVPIDTCPSQNLAYVEGIKYLTRIETGSDVYTISVTPPPPIAATSVTFSPQLSTSSNVYGAMLPRHSKGVDLKVDWSADADAKKRHAFVTVARINFVGLTSDAGAALKQTSWQVDSNNPVFDNTPRQPQEMVELIINDPVPNETVPGTSLGAVGLYLLVLTTTELSTDVSTNLALGSGGLAGKGVAFAFWVD
ncbi:MAG: hypothetical protein HY903_07375 [Deltaproteobacteria bacterium]|nr:hypothetical protein [Deltaproteobacteria bacterium]